MVTWWLLLATLMAGLEHGSGAVATAIAPRGPWGSFLRDELVIEAVSECVSAGAILALGAGQCGEETIPGGPGPWLRFRSRSLLRRPSRNGWVRLMQ